MKKGFTLIEILCVILIISIITTMAIGGVLNFTKNNKENLYCARIKALESAAIDYSKKFELDLKNSQVYYNGYPSLSITVADLIANKNITPDQDNQIINPIDNTSMNDEEIIIYYANNNIKAHIETNNICENS